MVIFQNKVVISGGYDPEAADDARLHPAVVTSTGELPPNIGTFIGERLDDADYDTNVPPWDSVRCGLKLMMLSVSLNIQHNGFHVKQCIVSLLQICDIPFTGSMRQKEVWAASLISLL